MSEEKRRFTRIPFDVEAEITANDSSYKSDGILNLSVGGCLLPIQANLEPGTGCQMRIIMIGASSELNIRIEGKIIRCDTGGVAINFTGVDPDSLLHLQNIIRYNSPDSEAVELEILEHPGLK